MKVPAPPRSEHDPPDDGFGEAAGLFLMVVLGGLVALAILFAEQIRWWFGHRLGGSDVDEPFGRAARAFVRRPETLFWVSVVCLQMGDLVRARAARAEHALHAG